MAAAPPTPPDEPALEGANRLAAAPPEPEAAVEVRAPEPALAMPMPVPPPASGVATSEPDPIASTAAPVTSLADAGLSAAEITVLLARGDKSFSSGDVASARLYYGRAAEAGDGQAALRLGETFDPVFLERAHLRSARGDLTAAWSWYRRARDLGAAEAEVLLNSLEAK
jgi:TPR repeat protein